MSIEVIWRLFNVSCYMKVKVQILRRQAFTSYCLLKSNISFRKQYNSDQIDYLLLLANNCNYRWEEEKRDDGVKWTTLEHKGPVFAPAYERLPRNVRFFYDGNPLELSEGTEEAATFYAKMLNHDYCTKDIFNENFFKDFRKVMTSKEREIIKDFRKCNFEEMHKYFVAESEKRKNASKEEKQAKKMENEALIKEYGVCLIDGHKEKIGNFRLEPPGLFRGRGEHPKMGMIKRRIQAEDVSINCGKDSRIPQAPPGHHWREVVHNNTVTWLASWVENIQGQVKYIMLNPSSKLKGEKDHVKYETARRLDKSIEKIRNTYRDEWKSKEMRVRQRAVALYFIDKLALRAGNEKDEDQADTVGCCSLRVEHVALHKELNGKEHVVVFDFLGKDSIRYYNEVQVERRVFKNLELFLENKKKGDDLFDRLNTQVLNEHLKELMEGKCEIDFLFIYYKLLYYYKLYRFNCQGFPYLQCFYYTSKSIRFVNKGRYDGAREAIGL